MDGAIRHPWPQRLHGRSLRDTHMVGRGRGQARLAIRLMSAWPNVWCECSSIFEHPLSTKVCGSTSVGTILPKSFTRPSVRTHRGSHPVRSGRPRGARRKVAWFMAFTYVLGRSETPPGHLISQQGALLQKSTNARSMGSIRTRGPRECTRFSSALKKIGCLSAAVRGFSR